jgi:hypothetical protein
VIDFIYLKPALENTMRFKIVACLLFAFACSSAPSLAQSPSYVVKQSPGVRQSRAEWRKITPSELSCIDQRLRQQRSSVPTLIQHGILPSDPRLANLRSSCANPIAQQQQATAPVAQLPSQPIDGDARERDVAELRQTVGTLQADLASSSDKIADLEKAKLRDVAELRDTIQTLQADLARSSDKIAELSKTKNELELAVKKAEQATITAENEKRQIEQTSTEQATKLHAIYAQLQSDKETVDAKRREWQLLAYLAIAGLLALVAVYALGRLARRKKATRLDYQSVESEQEPSVEKLDQALQLEIRAKKAAQSGQEFAGALTLAN